MEQIDAEPPSKRKRILTISDKVNIIYKLDEGVTPREIAKEYSVTTSAISRIKKKKIDLLAKTANEVSLQQKNLRVTQNPALEDMTYAWMCQKICLGEPITGPSLCRKALALNEKMNGPSTFKASNGWLHRFKRRHGIRNLTTQGEKLGNNAVPSEQFVKEFNKYIEDNGYKTTNIYNADETGLNWNSLPNSKNSRAGDKDRVTALFCTNFDGTHKIPALVIGKWEKPKCFKSVSCLSVIYKGQASALIDRALFTDWYTNHFIPAVREDQRRTNNRGKVLLLLDNAPCHSSAPVLNAIDEHFSVMYLPPNVTAILQPMGQGVIETIKNHYRQTLIMRLLLSYNIPLEKSIENLTLKDCCEIIATAWEGVTSMIIKKAWRSLVASESFVRDDENSADTTSRCSIISSELVTAFNQIEDFNITTNDIILWLNEDNADHGWAPLTDEQLIAEAIGSGETTSGSLTNCVNEPKCEVTEFEERYSAQDALIAINTVYKWCEKQPECTLSDLRTLNKIRNAAMEKLIQESHCVKKEV